MAPVLAGKREQDFRTHRIDTQSLNGVPQVALRAGRAGKVKYRISLPRDRLCDIVFQERKPVVMRKMGDILGAAGYAAIQGRNRMPLRDEEITQMRPDKTRAARDKNSHAHPRFSAVPNARSL